MKILQSFKRTQPQLSDERKKVLEAFKSISESDAGKLVIEEILKFCKLDSTPEPEFGILAERNGMRKVAKFINETIKQSNDRNS